MKMSDEGSSLLKRIFSFLETKAELNKSIDVLTNRTDFLKEDLRSSMQTYHSFRDNFVLKNAETIALLFGIVSYSTISLTIKRSLGTRRFRMNSFVNLLMPLAFGSTNAAFISYLNDSLFKLEQACQECFRLKVVGSLSLFTNVNAFLISSFVTWFGHMENTNYPLLVKKPKQTNVQYVKQLFNNYHAQMQATRIYTKSAAFIVLFSALAYLVALEEEREFAIIFTKYFNNLEFEAQTNKKGLYLDRDSII